YLCVLLEEIGKRKGISLEDMKYTLPSEIENPDKEKIKLRKFSFLVIIKKDEEIFFYGSEAQEMHDKMFKIHKGEVTEIHGRPACLGKATGIVKVIMNESEFSKMQQGDILVTSMTRPEFVPIMRKAAAIVTDEGGITCHAAIVSRELKIPCIISTRIATQKLKDGDKVEVDAEKGMIRKL
ncbi:MAG: phosphoenolpyruvate synthase, partial [Nanoarchaeota archaeon]|nr:phosphoenolpyruvate synthase [Nanoarchaeota archaeon]